MAFKGLMTRREIWVPTQRGFILILGLFAGSMLGILYHIHPFLAPTYPNGEGIIIVEGWLSDKDLEQALPLLRSESYHTIIAMGGPLDEDSIYRKLYPNHDNWADIIADQIIGLGIPEGRVTPVPIPSFQRHRTYMSAVAVKEWLDQTPERSHLVDILSVGVHARRTWLLFELALGKDYQVGIIALNDRHYDEEHWWHSSEGTKTVIKETVGYLYAKFLFWP